MRFPPLADAVLPLPPAARSLGSSAVPLSPLGWGMWRLPDQPQSAVRAMVDAALDSGITLFDTADIYGFSGTGPAPHGFGQAESMLGAVLADAPALRGAMLIVTKGGITPPVPYDSSAAWLTRAIDDSLTRLRIEQIDLWQLHRPDILTHPAEIARALDDAVAAGKVGAVGVSNYTLPQIAALRHFLTVPLVSSQPELSPLRPDPLTDGQADDAMMHGMAMLAWSPLAGGRLLSPDDERAQAVAAALDAVATRGGVSRADAALGWIMAHPAHPVPIIGSQNPARIRAAASALTLRWTRADWYTVLVAARGAPLP